MRGILLARSLAALTVTRKMNKSFNDDIVEEIIKLRVEAIATHNLYEKIHTRIEFYRRYISLAKNYKVRLAGSLIVIQGGRSTEDVRSQADKQPKRLSTSS